MEILIVDDDDEFRNLACQWMSRRGHGVSGAASGHDARQLLSQKHFDVAILDLNLPDVSGLELLQEFQQSVGDTEVIMLTGEATIVSAVEAMKMGANDYLAKPFPLRELEERCQKAAAHGRAKKEARQWKALTRRQQTTRKIIGESDALRTALNLLEKVAPTEMPVLILGETGVGKDLAASAIHDLSLRSERPFVIVNCAAIPEQLVESELFGHERGAFTGATEARAGLFEIADGGTLFIDEIGELPIAAQPKLLRVLEDGSLRRVGSSRQRRVDVRIIAATNRDLEGEVRERRFREDLLYRINVLPITLPSLRERVDDVPLLIRHFLPTGWKIDDDAETALKQFSWPGNIRQLRNVVERATILADSKCITLDDLPREIVDHPGEELIGETAPRNDHLVEVERAHVQEVMQACKGNKAEAARTLGIHRRKLYRLLDRLGLTE